MIDEATEVQANHKANRASTRLASMWAPSTAAVGLFVYIQIHVYVYKFVTEDQ